MTDTAGDTMITGLGAVSCHGVGVPALWRAMAAGAARMPDPVPDGHAIVPGGLVHLAPEPPELFPASDPGRASRLAVVAAEEAFADARLRRGEVMGDRLGLVVGTCVGDLGQDENRRARAARGDAPVFAMASWLADRVGPAGAVCVVSNACASSGYALGIAEDMIATAEADVVLVVGADACSRVMTACFHRLGAQDPVRSRPFGTDRAGIVLGEGAGAVVLESRAHAEGRGVIAKGRLTATPWSCDAHHPTAPEPNGTQIRRAMAAAAGGPLGCVIPHGTGTRPGDEVERAALGAVVPGVPLYSLKALLGHTTGASGCLAVVAATLVLRAGAVPGNVPVGRVDAGVPLRMEPVPLAAPAVLVNAFAFGGNNVSLVVDAA
jgi:3-oxoacyl-[acyl-carrier-protein] synthase II